MKPGILGILRDQFRTIPEVSTFAADLTGKVVIVTGANVGLGYETAKHFASMDPAKLILACRNVQKGDAAVTEILKSTSCSSVACWQLDLSDPNSVKAFVTRFEREGGGTLDILVENAGVNNFMTFRRAGSGWEETIATNHLGTAQLAFRMLPFLLKAENPRLVIVASDVHYLTMGVDEADTEGVLQKLNEENRKGNFFATGNRYFVSKLFNVLFVRAFAEHLPSGTALTVNAVNPGMCTSALIREVPLVVRAMMAPIQLLARTTETGSRMFVHAAVAKELEGRTAEYLNACEVNEPSDFVISEKGASAGRHLWDDTIAILSEKDAQVAENVKACLR